MNAQGLNPLLWNILSVSFFSPIAFLRNLPWCPTWEVDKIPYFRTSLTSFGLEIVLTLEATTLVPAIIPLVVVINDFDGR